MPDSSSPRVKGNSQIVLISGDAAFVGTLRGAFDANADFTIVEADFDGRTAERAAANAAALIVDLGSPELEGLAELRRFMTQAGELPVIIVIDSFDEIVARKLVQMRVVDILVKPVAPIELLRACAAVSRTGSEESQIYTFMPVSGGVGTTTLAILAASTLLGGKKRRKTQSTCLVDLNFYRGSCTDYLDIEPRLNLKEIELKPERLDRQLLESMVSHHQSGLDVIATRNLPTEVVTVAPNIVMSLLNVVCQCFEQIVLDMPRDWHAWTDNIVLGSNKLFLVSEATVPSVRRAKQLVEAISSQLGQRPQPKVIVNRFESGLFSSSLRNVDFARAIGESFAGTVPYNYRLVREAIDRGVPLAEIRKNSDVETAVERLLFPRTAKSPFFASLSRTPTLNWAWRGQA